MIPPSDPSRYFQSTRVNAGQYAYVAGASTWGDVGDNIMVRYTHESLGFQKHLWYIMNIKAWLSYSSPAETHPTFDATYEVIPRSFDPMDDDALDCSNNCLFQ